jgi:2-amino-4-hydroxy-6-hydroxymethyldihydropteridine diphosphokinase
VTRAYIALGSYLDSPAQQLDLAIEALGSLPSSSLVSRSSYYRSLAVGPGDQPDYLNAVACLDTALDAHALLQELQAIESLLGRVRTVHWGPRTIDLDLLLFGEQTIDSDTLCVPHPRMGERNFVLEPLLELDSNLTLPCGRSVASLLAECPPGGLWKMTRGDALAGGPG